MTPAVETGSLNHWTARKLPKTILFTLKETYRDVCLIFPLSQYNCVCAQSLSCVRLFVTPSRCN